MVVIKANANYHHAAGEDLFKGCDVRHVEYRKKWTEWPENFESGEFPLFIDIEVTSYCNLKCPFCATTFRGAKVGKGFMKEGIVKSIIDEGVDHGLYGVKFNIRGEPLLHPKICDFVAYAKNKQLIDIYFNTNAVLLTPELANGLIDAGLDRLSISAEGYTKEVYEKYRVGTKFEKVLRNIQTIQELKSRRGAANPKLRVQTVMLPELVPYYEKYKQFWSRIADEVAYLDYKEMKERKADKMFSWACPQMWQRMAVLWDGTILPCNHDDDAKLVLGKVGENSIYEAWNSSKLKEIREIHKRGDAHTINACNGCYLRDSEIYKLQSKDCIV